MRGFHWIITLAEEHHATPLSQEGGRAGHGRPVCGPSRVSAGSDSFPFCLEDLRCPVCSCSFFCLGCFKRILEGLFSRPHP